MHNIAICYCTVIKVNVHTHSLATRVYTSFLVVALLSLMVAAIVPQHIAVIWRKVGGITINTVIF